MRSHHTVVRPAARALGAEDVRAAYRRLSAVYDPVFGAVSKAARARAVALVNRLPGARVLEAGVGTGLSLPLYAPDKRITGIDLSAEMLALARRKVARLGLTCVEALREADAERTDLPDNSFDTAVAMFVASVVPHPDRLLAEMRRLVRPGGALVFVNHFSAASGPRLWIERALSPAARRLGWQPDFPVDRLLPPADLARAGRVDLPPFGLFSLISLGN